MNIEDIDPDKLDKFSIKALEGYLESNPELGAIKLVKLISESLLHLRKYIEDPKEKDITWENPAIKLYYRVEYTDDKGEIPFIFYEDDTQEKNTGEMILDRLFRDYPLSILLREITDYVVVFKQGGKTEARVSPQSEHLNKLTGAKREGYLSELGEKYFSDNKKPSVTLSFSELKLSNDKEPKTAKGSFLLDVQPLFIDLDSGEANYTVTAGFDIEGYKPTQWSKEEKKEFWEALDKELKAEAPQESFNFLEKLLEPEVKPVIKDKGEVYKQSKKFMNITQIISRNTGLKKKDYIGIGYVNEIGRDMAKWKNKGYSALVPTEDLSSLNPKEKINEGQLPLIPTPPKGGSCQIKNLYILCHMLQKENIKRDRTGKLEFSLKEYAIMRGKSEAQIARGGKFIDELKRDLISGGVTSYIVDLEPRTGRKSYLIQNLYGLEVPKAKSKDKWRVYFNEPYLTYILDSNQFYLIPLDVIQDTVTDEKKGYLLYFYNVVMSYANDKTNFKTQLKVSTLLDNIKAGDRIKDRPKEAFKVLCECIYYTTKFQFKAIKEVKFIDSGKCEKVRVITDLEKFKEWNYTDFKNEVLNDLGLTDIREALISFNHTPQKELTEVIEEPKQMGENRTTL